MLTWNSFVPRLGLAWDMGQQDGDEGHLRQGFANGLSDNFANSYNPFTNIHEESFRWHDLNTEAASTKPVEVNLNPT